MKTEAVEIADVEVKLREVLIQATPADMNPDDREKLYQKKYVFEKEHFSAGATEKLYDALVRIETGLKEGKKDDPAFRDLIERVSKMDTVQHRREVIQAILKF